MENIDNFINKDQNQIIEELTYNNIIQKLQEAKENNVPIEEGILGAIVGGLTGATFGPKLGMAICTALGIDPKGPLGNLITSRLIMGAIGTKIGLKI